MTKVDSRTQRILSAKAENIATQITSATPRQQAQAAIRHAARAAGDGDPAEAEKWMKLADRASEIDGRIGLEETPESELERLRADVRARITKTIADEVRAENIRGRIAAHAREKYWTRECNLLRKALKRAPLPAPAKPYEEWEELLVRDKEDYAARFDDDLDQPAATEEREIG